MSSSIIRKELTAFLNNHEPGVFVVKGRWGVGKTHLVQEIIRENKKNWRYKKTAYASLFGINSVTDLREQLVVALNVNASRGQEVISELGEIAKGAGLPLGGTFGRAGSFLIQAWMNRNLPYSKVFIDDIERRGSSLPIRYLLGFFSQLKEQYSCQVVLVLNEAELDEGSKKELEQYREKVFDREIEFIPSRDEVIKLGFPDATNLQVELLHRLEVDNIRVVDKVRQFLERLEQFTGKLSEGARRKVFTSAIILGWFYFNRNKDAMSWDFIKTYEVNGWLFTGSMDSNKDVDDATKALNQEKRRQALRLREMGYEGTEPLEKLLVDALEKGFSDPVEFSRILGELSEKVKINEARAFLTWNVWSIFHASFDDNESDFVTAMTSCFKEKGKYLDLHSLSEAVSIMEELEREDIAEDLCDIYFEIHPVLKPEIVDFSLSFSPNERVRKKIEERKLKAQHVVQSKDVQDILHGIIRSSGWALNDIETLALYSEDDWYGFFKEDIRNAKFRRSYIKQLVDFGRHKDEPYSTIGERAKAALQRLAKESKLNAVRVRSLLSK
jgi:hypothetical protein